MTIKEVEEKVGIKKANIRYYEEMGLIRPARDQGNNYRVYSEEDVELLEKIRFLRSIDISVEEIRRLEEGKITIEPADGSADRKASERKGRDRDRRRNLQVPVSGKSILSDSGSFLCAGRTCLERKRRSGYEDRPDPRDQQIAGKKQEDPGFYRSGQFPVPGDHDHPGVPGSQISHLADSDGSGGDDRGTCCEIPYIETDKQAAEMILQPVQCKRADLLKCGT